MSDLSQRLRQLVAINRAMLSTLEHEKVLRLVVEKTAAFTGADVCLLLLLSDEQTTLRPAAVHGIEPAQAQELVVPFDEGVNIALREALGYRPEGSFEGVPIMQQERIVGLLVVYHRTAMTRQGDDFMLRALADQAAIALEHARMYGELSEVQARQSRLLETILSNTTAHLAYIDADLKLLEANAAWCKAAGQSREELVGQSYREAFHTDSTIPILKKVRDSALPAELREIRENAVIRGGDPERLWDWSARPICSGDGNVEGIVISGIDVTEKVWSRRQLEEANRHKDEFLAMLAHELRNPLAAISFAVHIFKTQIEADEDPMLKRAHNAAARQVNHMARLLDDLLDVSRITRGKIDLKRQPVDLRGVVAQAVESTRPAIEAKEQELVLSLPPSPVPIDGDAHRLIQIVSNLLTNAVKYTENRGRIELSLRNTGHSAELQVRDTGMGISQDFLPYVFDLFTQSNLPLSRAKGGLGIGLTLVKRLVEMHGGDIEAYSEGLGQGSEFVARFPALRV